MSAADTIWTAEDVCNNLNISNIQLLNSYVKYIGTRWYIQNKTSSAGLGRNFLPGCPPRPAQVSKQFFS